MKYLYLFKASWTVKSNKTHSFKKKHDLWQILHKEKCKFDKLKVSLNSDKSTFINISFLYKQVKSRTQMKKVLIQMGVHTSARKI